jgi:hypothetical protein
VKFALGVIVAALFVLAVSPAPSRAQERGGDEAAAGQVPRARKIDEFAQARGCDHGARLDNLAIELQNNPDLVGHVIAYGPAGEGSGTGDYRLLVTRTYLVESRGIDAQRVKTINGGRYKERDVSFVEFWVVPPGADAPEPASYKNDVSTFTGKFSESETWDSFEWGELFGPPVGNSTLAGLADVLKSQPDTTAYVVAFNGKDSAPGAWRRVAQREADQLKEYGVAAGRVRIIFGGYGEELKIQRWVQPKDAPPPVEDAGAERAPSEASQIGRMGFYQLRYEGEARGLFEGFAQVLKADETLTAHLVVRLKWPRGEDDGEVVPPDPDEPPDLDPARLVEKWRADLRSKYGIGDQRLVVQFVPPQDESNTGELEAWAVPMGAAPPDPYAEDPSEAEAGDEETKEEGSVEKPKEVPTAEAGVVRVGARPVDFVRARKVIF